MRIDFLTLFPEMFSGVINASMLRLASEKGLAEFRVHNIRDYSASKHRNTDDYPFGGGAGMVMMVQPIDDCIRAVDPEHEAYRIAMTPRGRVFSQSVAEELAAHDRLLFLCGHYEGVDERALELADCEISIGDYVLTGGELPSMVVADTVLRLVPGVLGSEESAANESFSDGLLEHPQYTRPADYNGSRAPDVLLNGNHALICKWRRERSLELTARNRPELLKNAELSPADRLFVDTLDK